MRDITTQEATKMSEAVFTPGDVIRTPGNQTYLVYEVTTEKKSKYDPAIGSARAVMADRDGTPTIYAGQKFTPATIGPTDPRGPVEIIGRNPEQATAAAQYLAEKQVEYQRRIHEGEPAESPETIEGWLQSGIVLASYEYVRYSSNAGGEPVVSWDRLLWIPDVGYVEVSKWSNAPGMTFHAYPYLVRHLTKEEATAEARRTRGREANRPKLTPDGERLVWGA